MEKNEKIITAYKYKTLGVRNYSSDKKEFFVEDFINDKILDDFLDEVDTGESDITPAGKAFIENYFGFGNLARALLIRNKFFLSKKYVPERLNEVKSWIENLVPMETITFIEKARGNIKEGDSLREDLLPPKNI
jgi:hypothetical protein